MLKISRPSKVTDPGIGEARRTCSWVAPCLLVPNAWMTSGFFIWEETFGGWLCGGSCWRFEVCWILASWSDGTGFLYGIGRRIGADSCCRSGLKKVCWTLASWHWSDWTGFLYGIGRRIGADSWWRSGLKKLFWTFGSWSERGFWMEKLLSGRVGWIGTDSFWRSGLKTLCWTFGSWSERGFGLWKLPSRSVWSIGRDACCWRRVLLTKLRSAVVLFWLLTGSPCSVGVLEWIIHVTVNNTYCNEC